MEVLLLTTLFSVAFAVLFLALFVRDRQRRVFGGAEREALLPLDDEWDGSGHHGQPRAHGSEDPPRAGEGHEEHDDHGEEGCGCLSGKKPPCVGCLRQQSQRMKQ
ncbi:MAG: hypothetical protein KDM91_03325 [Verrucomicrobiae bacterium]|nr:hypothetical protein [Verrucomicrobiae bacterium]MCP5541363.1 hypothetical protein [Akkermansiaceae bacterium]